MEAVSYLHKVGVCHRDIKPDNLIFDLETSNVKLIDFNTAINITPGSYEDEIKGGTGLKIWSAPETRL
jgi:serine/threonine protein kinase